MLSYSSTSSSSPSSSSASNQRKLFYRPLLLLLLTTAIIAYILRSFENISTASDLHNFESKQFVNRKRQEYLQNQCDKLDYNIFDVNDLTEDQMKHMFVDEEHKFLYCYVPKVACTNWKRILMILTGKWKNGTDPLKIPAHLVHKTGMFKTLKNFTETERKQVLFEYTRFIIVRHPFERLLSAYRNKLVENSFSAPSFKKRIGRKIVKSLRQNASQHSLKYGDDVTFEEFIVYLLTPELSLNNRSTYNEHWERMSRLCNPCVMKYNVIGWYCNKIIYLNVTIFQLMNSFQESTTKFLENIHQMIFLPLCKYETLLDDSDLALKLIGADTISFPQYIPSKTSKILRQNFEQLPIGFIRKLYEIYAEDFKLFNYNIEDVLGLKFD